jgi:hypothetical protein
MIQIKITTLEGILEIMDGWLVGLRKDDIFTPLYQTLEDCDGKYIKLEITVIEEKEQ